MVTEEKKAVRYCKAIMDNSATRENASIMSLILRRLGMMRSNQFTDS